MRKLDYKNLKWDKYRTLMDKFWKKDLKQKGFPKLGKDEIIPNHRELLLDFYKFKGIGKERLYKEFFALNSLILKYQLIADKTYNYNENDSRCIQDLFLSGLIGMVGEALYNNEFRAIEERTSGDSLYLQYCNSLFMLIATDQTYFEWFNKEDNIILNLWNGNFTKVAQELKNIISITEIDEGCMYHSIPRIKEIILALINKDEKKLKEELVARIRKYRRNSYDGYLTCLDFVSIAIIKIAQKHGINIEIDIIEIPKFIFDKDIVKEEVAKAEIIPFVQEYIDKVKEMGYLI